MRLRPLLFLSFVLVSLIPVGILAYWEQQTALENELAAVQEKHLLLARNLTGTLDLYARNVALALSLGSDMFEMHHSMVYMDQLFTELNFNYVCVVDGSGEATVGKCEFVAAGHQERPRDKFQELASLRELVRSRPGQVTLSGVMPSSDGEPTLYAMKALPNGDFITGSLATDFIVQEQQKIAFGEKGHAAIIDSQGRVLGHPLASWIAEMKDISKLEIAQRMMRGDTGVMQFYSPALKADMVAGYTSVPSTGWGVMVPQPYSEFVGKAQSLQNVVLSIAASGVVIALLLGWWLSGLLARSLSEIATAVNEFAAKGSAPTLKPVHRWTPHEVTELSKSFEQMITEIDRKRKELLTVTDRAVKASEAKTKFLSSISHELRTPMNSILGFSQLLMRRTEEELNEKNQDSVRRIYTSAEHLMQLIDELLHHNMIEEGRVDLSIQDVEIDDIAKITIDNLKARAEESGIHMAYSPAPLPLQMIRADRKRIIQVLLNLLSNAVKYNKPGGKVTLQYEQIQNDMMRISISDTGIGIPLKEQGNVFTPFERLGQETGEIEGTGIGLAISKQLVELMGGAIGFKTTENVGSHFWIEMPLSEKVANEALPVSA